MMESVPSEHQGPSTTTGCLSTCMTMMNMPASIPVSNCSQCRYWVLMHRETTGCGISGEGEWQWLMMWWIVGESTTMKREVTMTAPPTTDYICTSRYRKQVTILIIEWGWLAWHNELNIPIPWATAHVLMGCYVKWAYVGKLECNRWLWDTISITGGSSCYLDIIGKVM